MVFCDFERKYLQSLNPQQRQAVCCVDGPILLLATPGSGKTTVLVLRLGYMTSCLGIDPARILTMTYTRAATHDMRTRFGQLFGEDTARRLQFRTINGVASKIIDAVGLQYGLEPFQLLSNEGERNRLLREIYQRVNGDYPEDSVVRDCGTQITYIKNMMLSEEEILDLKSNVAQLPRLYTVYQEELRKRRLMDYDDQLRYALRLLELYPFILERFQDQYRYICVDEAQDTSRIQHEIIRLLSARHENLFMVGDEDQSIYAFRAAYPEALMHFQEDHPHAQVLYIEENYRSTGAIVDTANRFIKKNSHRHDKTIRSTREAGEPVHLIPISEREQQYSYLIRQAPFWNRETAILFRNNDSALPLIDAFEMQGIPYNCRQFDEVFFSHRVVCDVLDIFHFAEEPRNADLFIKLYYKFAAGITRTAATFAVQESLSSGNPLLDSLLSFPELKVSTANTITGLIRNLQKLPKDSAQRAIIRIWEDLRYGIYAEQRGLDTGKYFILRILAADLPDIPTFRKKLGSLQETIACHQNSPANLITLSTIHSSKGLEYDSVYLLDILDGILPLLNIGRIVTEAEARQHEEDRRLFYVAMTRAKDELSIFLDRRSGSFPLEISRDVPNSRNKNADSFSSAKRQKNSLFVHKRSSVSPLSVGERVQHKSFGLGTVLEIDDDIITIDFTEKGQRKLSFSTSIRYGLIKKEHH